MYYGEKEGLSFTFGIGSEESGSLSKEELADYGSLNAYYESWNATSLKVTKIPSRACTLADFGLNKTDPKANQTFYNIKASWAEEHMEDVVNLRCLKEPVKLLGNFETAIG